LENQTFKKAFDSIIEADKELAAEALRQAEEEKIDLLELLSQGFIAGMNELGDQFGRGEIFLPELMISTEVMKYASAEVESRLEPGAISKKGKLVIGTVAGDVHDIGKGIVAAIAKTNGVEVYDLGREVPASSFVEKAIEVDADFIGSSALLTTTMIEQKKIEELLLEKGIRDKYLTMIGGAPVTKRWAEKIGADAYCEDAVEAMEFIRSHLK